MAFPKPTSNPAKHSKHFTDKCGLPALAPPCGAFPPRNHYREARNVSCTSPLARPTLCPFMQVPLALARPPIHKPVRIFSRHRERPCHQAHIRAAIHKLVPSGTPRARRVPVLEANFRPRCTLRKKNNLGNCFSAISKQSKNNPVNCFCREL